LLGKRFQKIMFGTYKRLYIKKKAVKQAQVAALRIQNDSKVRNLSRWKNNRDGIIFDLSASHAMRALRIPHAKIKTAKGILQKYNARLAQIAEVKRRRELEVEKVSKKTERNIGNDIRTDNVLRTFEGELRQLLGYKKATLLIANTFHIDREVRATVNLDEELENIFRRH